MLFQGDVTGNPAGETLRRWRRSRGEPDPYAVRLARGVETEREELDARLSEASKGWTVPRMSAVDRTILRLALYEMLRVEDVPPEVAASEAVELAKGFSGEESPAFVGGVLRGVRGPVPDRTPEEVPDQTPEEVPEGAPRG